MPNVSIVKSDDRRVAIHKSLELIAGDIKNGIGNKQIVIKPNLVSTSIQLASSHVDQIRGILDFLSNFYKQKIIIAEAACGDTRDAYKKFGYYRLLDEYDVELVDVNHEPYEFLTIQDFSGNDRKVKASGLLLDKDNYLISAAMLKAHDTVIVTLSIKNMAMGCLLFPDKQEVHQGYKQTNRNITNIAERVWPDLAVIDGLEGMEGNGPVDGTPIHVGVALASTDPLSADRVACEIMGVDFSKVGYLCYCAERRLVESDINKITIIGDSVRKCVKPFKLHSQVLEQYKWR